MKSAASVRSNRPAKLAKRKRLRTAAEARAWLEANGISQAEFARRHNISRMAVVDMLRGTGRGLRGDKHVAAVALGMKDEPKEPMAPTRKGR